MADTVTMTATERLEDERALLQADESALHALQQRLNAGERLNREEESTFVALKSAIEHSKERLVTLAADKRRERAVIDVEGLLEDWEALADEKWAAYERLAELLLETKRVKAAIKGIHEKQETRLNALEDVVVRTYMVNTFWTDANTVEQRFENQIAQGRVGNASMLSADDPGVGAIPPRVIENVVEGKLFPSREHRPQEPAE